MKKLFDYIWKNRLRFLKFGLVGGSGVLVNMGMLYILSDLAGMILWASGALAIELSILTNFLLNNFWTWSDRRHTPFFHRLVKYHVSAAVAAFGVNWTLLMFLTKVVGLHFMLSNLIGIMAGLLVNFILSEHWTFKKA